MITGFEFVLNNYWFIDTDRRRIPCRKDIGEYMLGVLENYHHLNTLRNDLDERKRYPEDEPPKDGSRPDGAHASSPRPPKRPAAPKVHEGFDEE